MTQNTEITWADWVMALSSVTRGVPGTERAGAFAHAVVTTEKLASEDKLKQDRTGFRKAGLDGSSVCCCLGRVHIQREEAPWLSTRVLLVL